MGLKEFFKTAIENSRKEELFMSDERRANLAFDNYSDPFIKEISWDPIKPGGASFKTNNLINKPNGNYKYVVSSGTKLFAGYFMGFSLIWLFMFFSYYQQEAGRGRPFDNITIIAFSFFPIIFFIVGFIIYTRFSKRKVFDLVNSCIYIGKQTISFNDIYAIQLLSEYVNGSKSNYNSYELNLVLKSKERINVIDHGEIEFIKKDSQIIGGFIGVPVWDLTKSKNK